jgi:hypothetical protein
VTVLHERRAKVRSVVVRVLAIGLVLCGCAQPDTLRAAAPDSAPVQRQDFVEFPPYNGPKRKAQVVEIGIPAKDLERYPELAEKRVGFGLSSILVETLFDTGRFDLLEGEEEILKRHLRLWQRTEDGFYLKDERPAGLAAPEFLVYAKVFDFAACSPEEQIQPGKKTLSCVTRVGVQVRIENSAGQFVPGTTNPLLPEGQYVHTADLSLFGNSETGFQQSAVGIATWKAMRYAMLRALERFDRQGW